MEIKRNILLNPGPATTTDTVKMAQIVPDICPREREFSELMKEMRNDLLRVVHADASQYTAVLFCGSGTINMDICLNSLVPNHKKALIVNNGAYSARAVEICEYYGLEHINLAFSADGLPDLETVEQALQKDKDIAVVYTTHQETGTGILNPVREIGDIAHKYHCTFVVDTTSTYAMIPIDMERDNIDFCMASAQKGLMSMTGLSFIVGKKEIIEASKDYPKRSYYCNLYLQYSYFEKTGEMHFTPPVQTVYATKQAIKEYFTEGEEPKWKRHREAFDKMAERLDKLGFKSAVSPSLLAGLVYPVVYPDDENWDFEKIHDYCYERGYTIYPGKIDNQNTFRICTLGAIDKTDIEGFFQVFEAALKQYGVKIPAKYKESCDKS